MNRDDIIALVDCNSFYCSCERVFRPDLWGKPVAVLSNGDGAIVSRTDELKALGVGKMSEPYFKVKEEFKKLGVHVFSSNYSLYANMSNRVMQVLSEFTPELEIYSIDEAFLSLKGFENYNLVDYCKKIKEAVYRNTGIPVSIGIGPTKVLAKVANHVAKKNKVKTGCVFSLMDEKNRILTLKSFPVSEVWGIGWQSTQKLANNQIYTAYDLMNANQKFIQKNLTIVGSRIQEELKGVSCINLQLIEADKKQIISSRSFDNYITTLEQLKESVALHVSEVAIKLRKQKLIAKNMSVFIQTNPYSKIHLNQYSNSCSMNLLSGSSHTGKLIKYAFNCLEQIYKDGYYYKKAGVVVNDLVKKSGSQLDFFYTFDTDKEDETMRSLDQINADHGKHTLKYAALGIDRDWEIKFKLKSPNYTTRWSDLLVVR